MSIQNITTDDIVKAYQISIPWAKATLKIKEKPTASRGKFDKAIAWVRFVGIGAAIPNVDQILELIRKATK